MAPVIVFSVVVLVFLMVAYASFNLVNDYGKVGYLDDIHSVHERMAYWLLPFSER